MEITRTSPVSGKTITKSFQITPEQWAAYQSGVHIQKSLGHLSPDDREFILTGITSDEWNEIFKDEDDSSESDFIPCSRCDGHPACEDFGCAIELGLGRMMRKNIEPGNDDWS